ncbi:MAG: hypothetical protein AAFX55_07320 [Bacteroidota bacterium]
METKYLTFKHFIVILLLMSFNSYSQHKTTTPQTSAIVLTEDVRINETLEDFTAYLLVNSLVEHKKFNYRRLLRASRQNPKMIVIDASLTISSTDLLKVFKKVAKKADELAVFKSVLFSKIPLLEATVSDYQLDRIYTSFRASTFNGYLDEVRLALGTNH